MATTKLAPGTEEPALLGRARAGDADAFYELVRPYERALFLAARGILDCDADAEEAAQEAVLKAFRSVGAFRGESKFSTWIIQITVNEALQRLRRERRHLFRPLDQPRADENGDYIPVDFADWREIPSEAVERAELRQALQRGLASLDPIYRSVFVLRDVQQLNIAETARLLGITEANVKTRLRRARLQMREALAPGADGSWLSSPQYKKVRP